LIAYSKLCPDVCPKARLDCDKCDFWDGVLDAEETEDYNDD
jgi:hypothetical protein